MTEAPETEPALQPPAPPPVPPPLPSAERTNGPLVLGGILVIGGLALFASRALDLDFSVLGWPSIIIGVGLVIGLVGLFFAREEGMVVGGTVVTTVGLVLWYQNQTGNWATWAYAWALVGPAASGLGIMLWSLSAGDGAGMRRGLWTFLGGLAVFAVGFLFFEGVIGLSGTAFMIDDWVLPAVVIAIGVVLLARGLMERREPAAPAEPDQT